MLPRKPKVELLWCNFSPLGRFGNQNLSAEQSKMKVRQFQTCRPKKGECCRIRIRNMKNHSGHFLDYIVLVNGAMITKPSANCQDHLQSSFAQVLGEIRSQSSLAHLLCSSGFRAMWKGSQQPPGASSIEVWTWLPSSRASKKHRRWRRRFLSRVGKQVVDANCRFLQQSEPSSCIILQPSFIGNDQPVSWCVTMKYGPSMSFLVTLRAHPDAF